MYKQRSKRTGTPEDRRKRYEKRMEKERSQMVAGHGKAFAGSRRNKHLAADKRFTAKRDWFKLQLDSTCVDPKSNHLTQMAREMINAGEACVDHNQYLQPNHQSRAVDIRSCFPDVIGNLTSEDHLTLLEKIQKKFGRGK